MGAEGMWQSPEEGLCRLASISLSRWGLCPLPGGIAHTSLQPSRLTAYRDQLFT